MTTETSSPEQAGARQIAEAVQNACIEEALRSYEDARLRGLCAEGAWEAAVGAMQSFDFHDLADDSRQEQR